MITVINFVLSVVICFAVLMVLGKLFNSRFWSNWEVNAVIAVFSSVLSLVINA